MKLNYQILWIDDSETFFKNHENVIIDHLNEKGIKCEIIKCTSVSDFNNKQGNTEHQKKYDLFLIDLNLDHGNTGDEVIEKIRKNTLVDVIFYSTHLKDVRKKINEKNIEGVYATSRDKDDFEEKVLEVIDVTIKKVQDVNNLRGLIIAEVAELDRMKKDIIKQFAQKNPDHNNLKKYIRDKVFGDFSDNIRKFDYLSKDDGSYKNIDIDALIDSLIYDSYKKARTVSKINQDLILETYHQEIIKKRNVLAHEKEKKREDGTLFLSYPDGEELNFSEENCIQIRKDIHRYKEILKQITTQL